MGKIFIKLLSWKANQISFPVKKILNLTCLLAIFMAFSSNAFGQQFGVTARGGISRIYGQLELRNYPQPTMTTSFSPSFQAGMYYNLPTGKSSSIGAELLYSKVQGEQTFEWDYNILDNIDGIDVRYYGSHITSEHISWLSLPVYYGVTFKRFTFNAGFQLSYALSSSGRSEFDYVQILTDENEEPLKRMGGTHRELDDLDIKAFDFGPRVGGLFRLTNRLSMEGMFYYGLNNINQLKSSEEALKIQQMTVGIRYALWSLY
ncbi:MAG TPA: outer membrane beta-barrel protein [Prolixibacteraceae bacterium]|nr:outer membrane beta-barrel protein [Prolixibacteraceae bacterium]